MPRRYRRRRIYPSRSLLKYSSETTSIKDDLNSTQIAPYNVSMGVVPAIPNQGTRKVKNFTLNLDLFGATVTDAQANVTVRNAVCFFALVFCPEGTIPSPLNVGTGANPLALYNPNQNVIVQGICKSTQPVRIKTRLARNLNSGDAIFLCMVDTTRYNPGDSSVVPFSLTLNYAVAF